MLTNRSGTPWSPYQKPGSQRPAVANLRERGAGPTRRISRISSQGHRRDRAVVAAGMCQRVAAFHVTVCFIALRFHSRYGWQVTCDLLSTATRPQLK